jgi:hypothetical protein
MAKLKVSGSASGTGTITLIAPATDTNRTLTLPDSAGTLVNTAPSTSGNVLTSDGTNWASSAPAAGGGRHTLLTTITASSATTVDFTSGIDNTYQRYLVTITNGSVSNDAAELKLRVGTGATPTWVTTGKYEWHIQRMQGTSGSEAHANGSNTNQISLTDSGIGNQSVDSFSWNVEIFNPSDTSSHTLISATGMAYAYQAYSHHHISGAAYEETTAVTALRFYMSSGSLSGTFKLYGIT